VHIAPTIDGGVGTMTTGGAPIQFLDENGVRWTVTWRPAEHADLTRLEFVSETGDRRATEVIPLSDDAWKEINELSWQSLLRGAGSA
jgi:hypothetical protein